MATKKRNYTLLFVPDDNSRTVSIHVNRKVVRSLVVFLVLLVITVGVLIYFSGGIALKLQLVASLQAENDRLREQNAVLHAITERIERIEEMDRYFTRLALHSGVTPPPVEPLAPPPPQPPIYAEDAVDEQIATLQAATGELAALGSIAADPEEFIDAVPYLRPVEGWVTRTFSAQTNDTGRVHDGLDIGAARGTPIQATAPGVVAEVGYDPFFGNMVTIHHQLDFITRYGHCSQVLVSVGTHVKRGQTIALVGNTGRSTAPHVHYEILKNGRPVDPMRYILSHR